VYNVLETINPQFSHEDHSEEAKTSPIQQRSKTSSVRKLVGRLKGEFGEIEIHNKNVRMALKIFLFPA
jgi:hypothetical protein